MDQNEIEAAYEKEQQTRRNVLFPVRIDDSVYQGTRAWIAYLRRMKHIGDFTGWKDSERYQQAFSRLLRDLIVQEL